jgi:oligoendopeptidase F
MEKTKAAELDLCKIPLYQPRKFVPANMDFSKVQEVCALYQELLKFPINSWESMEAFIAQWSELESAIGEYGSVLYIRMTCQTDDKSRSEAYKHLTQEIIPAIKPLDFELKKKLVAAYDSITPKNDYYFVYIRNMRADVELFRQENIELEKQEHLAIQEYQTICGAMTVEFNGEHLTMPQIGRKLSEPDRTIREKAWRAMMERRKQDAEKLDDIYDKMISLRNNIATNAGFKNFRDFRFKEWYRFDYTPEDCFKYHDAVTQAVVPAMEKIFKSRREIMKLDSIRPWDFDVHQPADPYGRKALAPYKKAAELVRGVRKMVGQLCPEFDNTIAKMDKTGLLDLVSRKGKAPGGYQSTLNERRTQFIFGNTVGSNGDIYLLLHEGGHAFHSEASRDFSLVSYRQAPLEFCEVASQAMELIGSRYLTEFYSEADAKRAWREQLEDVICIFAWIANIDAFQHWIYENPTQSKQGRRKGWLEINRRFYGELYDWSGLLEYREMMWHRQSHLFQCPLYYIEYGISLLGAIGIWLQSRKDINMAVNNYRKALALGGSRPLPELFKAAGLEFDFSVRTVKPLIDALMEEWEKVKEA